MADRNTEVVTAIEQEILEGSLNPGERLPFEEKLGSRFNASRTVIREAIQQLRGRGTWHDDVIATHRCIFQVITDGDAGGASTAMRRHLLLSRRHYVDIETGT